MMSGSFACSPLCVFHHLSVTCPVLHLSPKSFVSNPMSALVAVSCSGFIIMFFFRVSLLVSVLYSLCVFLLSQDRIMFHHGFMRFTTCLPLVSYLVPLLLSQIPMSWQTMRQCCLWFMLFSVDMDQTLPAGASITTNMQKMLQRIWNNCLGSKGCNSECSIFLYLPKVSIMFHHFPPFCGWL